MKTIDELLCEVAKNVNAAAPKENALKTDKPKESAVKTVNADKPKNSAADGISTNVCAADKYDALSLDLARELAYAAVSAAEKMGLGISVAICNDAGNLVLFNAMDSAILASLRAAQDKAYTAAALHMPTHTALKESRGGAFDGLSNGGGILLLGGGYPLEANGKFFGGIGISGGSKEQDMTISKLAAEYFKARIKKA